MYPNSKLIKDIATTKEELNKLYWIDNLNTRQIASYFGVSQPTARKLLRQFNIQLRSKSRVGIPPANKGKRLSSEWRKKIGDAQRGQIRGQRTERITRICQFCLNGFEKLESHINSNNQAKFCAPKCFYSWRKLQPKKPKKKSPHKKFLTNCKQCNKEIFRRKEEIKKAKHGCFCPEKCFGLWQAINKTGDKIYNFLGDDENYYGPSWPLAKRLARERDNNTCQCCCATSEEDGQNMSVHHWIRFKIFKFSGLEDYDKIGNHLDNLICLCNSKGCHKKIESITDNLLAGVGVVTLKEVGALEKAHSVVTPDFKKTIINQIKSTIFFPDYQI